MDRDPNFNPMFPYPPGAIPSPVGLPDEVLMTAFAYVKSLGSSGSSTVAIDNKIEQAMDLVKSHLMYAVREEVEVLKEQIKELMERLSQLEYENNILRAAATPDTLAKLTSTPQSAQPPSSSTSSS